jgi:6-phosphofructokinase 1
MKSKAFLCHANADAYFTLGLAAYLKRHLDEVFYFEEQQEPHRDFRSTIKEKIEECNVFVTVAGETVSPWQVREIDQALRKESGQLCAFFTIRLPDRSGAPSAIPDALRDLGDYPLITAKGSGQNAIREAAIEIVTQGLRIPWRSSDNLPLNPHLFSYEKDITAFFVSKARLDSLSGLTATEERERIHQKILEGCPQEWPDVVRWSGVSTTNCLIDKIGIGRDWNAHVLITSLVNGQTFAGSAQEIAALRKLSFPEAGPRAELFFPRGNRQLNVAVLVSGGIAPGINAAIDGIVQRHWLYAEAHGYQRGLTILGLRNGFQSFDNVAQNHFLLAANAQHYFGQQRRLETSNHVNEGGSILGTSRVDELIGIENREEALRNIVSLLAAHKVDILYVIGGDGSMKAAHALWSIARAAQPRAAHPLSVVAVPKTMDNDILWVWQSFGFLSAVEKAREVIEQLNTEVTSNPRLCVAQLYGSDSGFVVSHAVLASGTGHCDLALIPEVEFSMEHIADYLLRKISERNEYLPRALVVLAETAIPVDAMKYVGAEGAEPEIDIELSRDEKAAIRAFQVMRDEKQRIQGQTNDFLRTAGLKIVSRGLERLLSERGAKTDGGATDWSKLRVFTNEPRHLLRTIPPSCSDIIIGHRMGTLAVDNAMAGYTDCMISQWLTEYVLVPLELVVLGRKRIPDGGIFWKSVLAKTGQPAKLS